MMWEILSSADFKTNLLAGAVFFVLEAVLIVGVVQYVLQRRLDGRWASSRDDLCANLSQKWRSFTETADRVAIYDDQESYMEAARNFERIEQDIAQVIQTFSQALDPELMKSAATLLAKARELEWTCSYLVTSGTGSVDLAVTEFIEGADLIVKMQTHIGGPRGIVLDWDAEAEKFDQALKSMREAIWGDKKR